MFPLDHRSTILCVDGLSVECMGIISITERDVDLKIVAGVEPRKGE